MGKTFWVYILNCSNGTYYTGYTTDLARRYQEHISGTLKCKYTRSFKPISIAQSWKINGSKSKAMKIEKFIKALSKSGRKELILNPDALSQYFDCDEHDKKHIDVFPLDSNYISGLKPS